MRQCRQSERRLEIVGEDQKRAAIGPHSAVCGHSVQARHHAVFTDSPMKVASRLIGAEDADFRQYRAGALAQVRRPTEEFRQHDGEGLERGGRCLARGQLCIRGREARQVVRPPLRQPAGKAALEFLAQRGVGPAIVVVQRGPSFHPAIPPRLGAAHIVIRLGRHVERWFGRKSHDLLGAPDFLGSERGTVGGGSPLLGRRRIADLCPEDDQMGTIVRRGGSCQRAVDCSQIVAVVHSSHLPAIGLEPAPDVLSEGKVSGSVDGDVIVVVDEGELAKLQMTGQRGGLARDAFHEVAVTHEAKDPVIDHRESRLVEFARKDPLRDGHSHRVPDPLAQRPGGHLDAGGEPALRMARGSGAPLPEPAKLIQRKVVAGEVQQAVEQHRCVPARQNEAVAVDPVRMVRAVTEMTLPEHVGRRGKPQGCPWVAALGQFDRVHGEGTNRVDTGPGLRIVDGGENDGALLGAGGLERQDGTPCARERRAGIGKVWRK